MPFHHAVCCRQAAEWAEVLPTAAIVFVAVSSTGGLVGDRLRDLFLTVVSCSRPSGDLAGGADRQAGR